MKIADANFAVVDTETTGLDYSAGDRVVQIAAVRIYGGEVFSSLVNPMRPIPALASAVHHLTDEDVANALPIGDVAKDLRRWLGHDAILFAHNAQFDSSMLPELADHKWCCTKRLAQHLIPDAPAYSNQVLRYHLRLPGLDGLGAHEALDDALITNELLRVLIARYLEEGHPDDIDALLAFAAAPILYRNFPFGKYRNEPLSAARTDYIEWMLRTDIDADLRHSLRAELRRREIAA